jgi:hypothetical protein
MRADDVAMPPKPNMALYNAGDTPVDRPRRIVDITRETFGPYRLEVWHVRPDTSSLVAGAHYTDLADAIADAAAKDPDEIHFKGFTPKENN